PERVPHARKDGAGREQDRRDALDEPRDGAGEVDDDAFERGGDGERRVPDERRDGDEGFPDDDEIRGLSRGNRAAGVEPRQGEQARPEDERPRELRGARTERHAANAHQRTSRANALSLLSRVRAE